MVLTAPERPAGEGALDAPTVLSPPLSVQPHERLLVPLKDRIYTDQMFIARLAGLSKAHVEQLHEQTYPSTFTNLFRHSRLVQGVLLLGLLAIGGTLLLAWRTGWLVSLVGIPVVMVACGVFAWQAFRAEGWYDRWNQAIFIRPDLSAAVESATITRLTAQAIFPHAPASVLVACEYLALMEHDPQHPRLQQPRSPEGLALARQAWQIRQRTGKAEDAWLYLLRLLAEPPKMPAPTAAGGLEAEPADINRASGDVPIYGDQRLLKRTHTLMAPGAFSLALAAGVRQWGVTQLGLSHWLAPLILALGIVFTVWLWWRQRQWVEKAPTPRAKLEFERAPIQWVIDHQRRAHGARSLSN